MKASRLGTIDPALLSLLVCPKSHAPLVEHDGWLYSSDADTRLKYPIRDGIPILLGEESRVADVGEHAAVMGTAGAGGTERPPVEQDEET